MHFTPLLLVLFYTATNCSQTPLLAKCGCACDRNQASKAMPPKPTIYTTAGWCRRHYVRPSLPGGRHQWKGRRNHQVRWMASGCCDVIQALAYCAVDCRIIDAAHTVCGAQSTKRLSIRPSAPSIDSSSSV